MLIIIVLMTSLHNLISVAVTVDLLHLHFQVTFFFLLYMSASVLLDALDIVNFGVFFHLLKNLGFYYDRQSSCLWIGSVLLRLVLELCFCF